MGRFREEEPMYIFAGRLFLMKWKDDIVIL